MIETLLALGAVIAVTLIAAWVSAIVVMLLAGLFLKNLELELLAFGWAGMIVGGVTAFLFMFNWAVHYV